MTNFQKFKCELTLEQLTSMIACSSCPLYNNECAGFCSVQEKHPDQPLEACRTKLIEWFNQEASK